MSRQDLANLALIAGTALCAHLWPLQTLLGAYAFLGPAHYLTELSWLRDKRFFTRRAHLTPLAMLILAGGLVVGDGTPAAGAVVAAALTLAALDRAGLAPFLLAAAAVVAGGLGAASYSAGWPVVLAFTALVPTAIHVAGFTAVFLVKGARGAADPRAWLVPLAFSTAAASFVAVPTAPLAAGAWSDNAIRFFGTAAASLQLPMLPLSHPAVFGALGFAYAFHYLNWFSQDLVDRLASGRPQPADRHHRGMGRGDARLPVRLQGRLRTQPPPQRRPCAVGATSRRFSSDRLGPTWPRQAPQGQYDARHGRLSAGPRPATPHQAASPPDVRDQHASFVPNPWP